MPRWAKAGPYCTHATLGLARPALCSLRVLCIRISFK